MPRHSSHILELARRGAEHRYRELKTEMESLVRHFPHLKGATAAGAERALSAAHEGTPAKRPRRRRKLSAAARKAISLAQKKRWAAQKAAQKKK
jgi:hypothetical protein